MIVVGDLTLVDAAGAPVPLNGELLCFVEHAFTPEAERVLRLAARAHAAGGRFRVVSVDSAAALAAWVAAVGVVVPVGADPSGELARRIGRLNEGSWSYIPGWAQVDRGGNVVAIGEDEVPGGPVLAPEGVRPEPPAGGASLPGWVFYAGAGALALAAGVAYWRSPPPGAAEAIAPSAASIATEPAALPAATPEAPLPKPRTGPPKGEVGGGWYAVPPSLAGNLVRYVDGVLEVEGADLAKPPMACLSETTPMTGAVSVAGSWALDHVGTPGSKGARVGVRLLDAGGKILPQGVVPGGSQVFVANGRLVQDWASFKQTIPQHEAAAQVRLCVDNQGGSGVVRVRDVVVGVE
ncbi:hypothetical protein LBMAG42_32290 [Deltaproteobacteria bacterium]|nr:hypothetical protein LBMAG42_32290 [Deltaproteobacteria bacterium]